MNRLDTTQKRFAAVLLAAVALAAFLVGASRLGAGGATTAATPSTAAPGSVAERTPSPEPSLFAGLAQQGAALGSPSAPVTLVEYADPQCPYCADWARQTLPTLVEDYVATGKLRIVFRGLTFLGPDSDKALRTAIAAGRENHFWDVIHGLYQAQGAENSGWVTDELVEEVASGVPGLDGIALLSARWESSIAPDLESAATAAQIAGVNSTPSFEVGATGGELERVEIRSLGPEGIVPAIEAELAT